jgi:hypothetical protein
MSTAPSDGTTTLNTTPSQSKLSRKQRREVLLANAAQQAVEGVAKLSRRQRRRARFLNENPNAPGPSNPSIPAPSYDWDNDSYNSSEDSSYTASTSEGSESLIIGKTKPVLDPEAWLRGKELIKP